MQGIIHFELSNNNSIITAEIYCRKLLHLKRKQIQKCPFLVNVKGNIVHQHYKPVLISKRSTKYLLWEEDGDEKLLHPPYHYPDLNPTDYQLRLFKTI